MGKSNILFGLCKRFGIETAGKDQRQLWKEVNEAKQQKVVETANRMGIVEEDVSSEELTIEERGSIMRYITSKAYIINDALRNDYELSDSEKEMVRTLNIALSKMPKYKGDLTRSLNIADDEQLETFIERHKVGEVVKYKEFISTTKGERYNPRGNIQIIIFGAQKGADISELNQSEQEVLYRTNSKFKVINMKEFNGTYFFNLKEYTK